MSNSIADLLGVSRPDIMRGPGDLGTFVQGTVTENNNKEKAGMVKVEFTSWTKGKNICEWIPVLRPYAGAGYGHYFMPEIGDVVMLGFFDAAQTKAVVMGVLYPANAAFVGESFEDNNYFKCVKTKGGIDLKLDDTDGKQSITLKTPKGLTVLIEDENVTVTINDQENKNYFKIDSTNGAMELVAEKNITIKTGKCEMTMDGEGGAVNIKCDKLTMEGSQTAKLAGNQSLTLEGGTLKAEGKQTAALKGGTMTQINGQMVKIN